MTSILVTGGAGYIGSHTAKALAESGYRPVVLDNLFRGHRSAVRYGPFVEADIRDSEAVRQTIRDHKIEAIVHFAALAYVGESVEQPGLYFSNNVEGFRTVLQMAAEEGVGKVVFSSSCTTYGNPDRVPIDESCPQSAVSPYGDTKLIGEGLLRWFEDAYGIRSVALRYFNAAGADPDGELGEDHDPETHLIPNAILAAMGRKPTLSLFGADYPTRDGTNERDYVHVADLASAHVASLQYLHDGGSSTAMNLGSETGSTVREVIAMVEAVSGQTVPVVEGPRRPGDAVALYASANMARSVLGWHPKHSDLKTICETAWQWHSGR
ncbi:MAG: UDP-glucose 4-epimerase GalE [Chlorobia bacterium]|nr:UDP-glucose 4-epimerase GalE [Fimbriimonadaceae bacterium]